MSTLVEIRKQLHAYEFNVVNEKIEELSKLIDSMNQRLLLIEQTSDFENSIVIKENVNVVSKVLETIKDTDTSTLSNTTVEITDVPTEEKNTAVDDEKKTKVRKAKNKK